jgi:hypothetical protein
VSRKVGGPSCWSGIVTGAAGGSIVALLLAAFLDGEVAKETQDNLLALGTVWATLVAAGVAFIATQSQVRQNQALDQERRHRSLAASVATLPLILSEIVAVCESRALREFSGKGNEPDRLSHNVMATLRDCIRDAEPAEEARLAEIMKIYQILDARGRNIMRELISEDDGEYAEGEYAQIQHSINWITLRAITGTMFPFARNRGPMPDRRHIPSDLDGYFLGVALANSTLDVQQYPKFFRDLRRTVDNAAGEFFQEGWSIGA